MSQATSFSASSTTRVSEKFILLVLTAIQFTNILDFVILMPLGPQLMRIFSISPQQFGFVVSAYTFSAGASGFLAAFFLDRFDRKKSLLTLYAGFTIGTFLCSVAPTYWFLVGARVIAGMFGGILGATILSIVGDLIPYERRGNAMGMVMTSFALAQIAGVPAGLFLANHYLSPYFVSNVRRTEADLPYIYFFGGIATIISSRVIGKLADRYGKLPVFTYVTVLSIVPILLVTNFPPVSLPVAIVVLTLFMVLVSGRAVPSMAMVTATVHPKRRGSFMSINSSVQQFSAGIASFGSGLIIGKAEDGSLTHFGVVGLIAAFTTLICIVLARRLRFVEVSDSSSSLQGGLKKAELGASKIPERYKPVESVSEIQ